MLICTRCSLAANPVRQDGLRYGSEDERHVRRQREEEREEEEGSRASGQRSQETSGEFTPVRKKCATPISLGSTEDTSGNESETLGRFPQKEILSLVLDQI